MNPPDNNTDPQTRRKANRALVILYVVMFLFILAPFVAYFLMRKP